MRFRRPCLPASPSLPWLTHFTLDETDSTLTRKKRSLSAGTTTRSDASSTAKNWVSPAFAQTHVAPTGILTRTVRSLAGAVVSGSWDQTLRITPIDAASSQPTPDPLVLRLPHKVYSLAVSPTKIVCAMGARHVWIWDIPQLKQAMEAGKKGDEIEPWQRRESSLKFMTRAVRIMHNDQGRLPSNARARISHRPVTPETGTCGRYPRPTCD